MISLQCWRRDIECDYYLIKQRRWSWRRLWFQWVAVETGIMFMGMRLPSFARAFWKRKNKKEWEDFKRCPLRHLEWENERKRRRAMRKPEHMVRPSPVLHVE